MEQCKYGQKLQNFAQIIKNLVVLGKVNSLTNIYVVQVTFVQIDFDSLGRGELWPKRATD